MKRLRKMKNSYNGKNDMSRLTALAALAAVLAILTVLSACGSGAEGGGTTAAGQQAQAKTTGPTDGAGSGDAGAGGSGSGTNIELPSTLRIGFISPTNKKLLTGPEGWAQNIGLLEKELGKYGVTSIEVYNFPNGPNLNEALAAGSIDVGIYGDTPAINAKSAGLNTRLINQTHVGMNVWLVVREDGPSSVQDLKGKKVSTAQGSYMHRYLLGVLKEEDLEKNTKVLHILPSDAEAALARGDIAAYAFPSGVGPLVLEKGGYKTIDEAKNRPLLRGSSVTVIKDEFLQKHPEFPRIWNDIRAGAIRDARNNSEAYYEFYAEVAEYSVDVVKVSFPLDQFPEEPFTSEGLELLRQTKEFLHQEGISRSDFSLDDWIVRTN
jgi:ABC-type nitrate/sulfonate/bicarbonate transport system substrate-binding protein